MVNDRRRSAISPTAFDSRRFNQNGRLVGSTKVRVAECFSASTSAASFARPLVRLLARCAALRGTRTAHSLGMRGLYEWMVRVQAHDVRQLGNLQDHRAGQARVEPEACTSFPQHSASNRLDELSERFLLRSDPGLAVREQQALPSPIMTSWNAPSATPGPATSSVGSIFEMAVRGRSVRSPTRPAAAGALSAITTTFGGPGSPVGAGAVAQEELRRQARFEAIASDGRIASFADQVCRAPLTRRNCAT